MAGLAVDATTSLRGVEVTTAELRTEARKRDSLLDQLRLEINRSSTVVRDYLIEQDDSEAENQKADLALLRTRIDGALRAYERELPPEEHETFLGLRGRVESYWRSVEPALHWDAAARRAKGGTFLQDVILPLSTEMVQLTNQITAVNERNLDAAEDRIRALHSHLRRRVVTLSAVVLAVGLLLGAMSIRRVQHLEGEAKARFAEVEEARRELQDLSARLLTAQEEERRNLARELHDEIGQGMSAMLVELGRAEAAPDSATRTDRLATARRMAEATVGMVRNMALLLRPSMLDDLGLVAALKWQAREVTRRTGLNVKMVADDVAEDLPDSHRTCLYRVVQEALNNCASHSQASQVRVVVLRDQAGLSVTVQDDGIGFEPSREKGLGLLGIEERIERLGGSFSIESKPGKGTVLSFHLPLVNDGRG